MSYSHMVLIWRLLSLTLPLFFCSVFSPLGSTLNDCGGRGKLVYVQNTGAAGTKEDTVVAQRFLRPRGCGAVELWDPAEGGEVFPKYSLV